MLTTRDLYDLSKSIAGGWLADFEYPWQALAGIGKWLISTGHVLDETDFREVLPTVWVHRNATIAPTAHLSGPCIVDDGAEIRHGAFIRGNALIGKGCVVGNSVEVKNALLFDGAQVPHFNYIGDSIVGYKAHFGAGAITSNLKSDRTEVVIKTKEKVMPTGLKKVGSFVGDGVEIGCNSVLNPGVVIGKNTTVYPLSFVRGVLPADGIYKRQGEIVEKRR